jgi:hypothetical protein
MLLQYSVHRRKKNLYLISYGLTTTGLRVCYTRATKVREASCLRFYTTFYIIVLLIMRCILPVPYRILPAASELSDSALVHIAAETDIYYFYKRAPADPAQDRIRRRP